MSPRFAVVLAAFVLMIFAAHHPVRAAGGGGGSDSSAIPAGSATVPSEYARAKVLIRGGNYADAAARLERAAGKALNNPDIHNLLGFSNRKLRRFDVAEKHYERALALNPRHRGALEWRYYT